MRKLCLGFALVVATLAGCAAPGESSTPAEVYEPRETGIGSNIPSRQRRPAATPEERERARAEAEAMRNNSMRTGLPRSVGTP